MGSLDESTAWFEFNDVAHLFGTTAQRTAKFLQQAGTTGDIEPAKDVRSSDRSACMLSHRAVVAVGYLINYGRATAFRHWCASGAVFASSKAEQGIAAECNMANQKTRVDQCRANSSHPRERV
jgi:prophage antirepressor-like protein